MMDILQIARARLLSAVRERVTLFWFLIFPIFLLVILTLIFGQVGENSSIHFEIALINEDADAGADSLSAMIMGAFEHLSTTSPDTEIPLFEVHQSSGNDQDFLDQELTELRRGHRAAILVIPQGFHQALIASLASRAEAGSIALQLYMSEANVSSETATGIIEQVIAEMNREILVRSGSYDSAQTVSTETHWIGQQDGETPYINIVLPAIILMGFFTNGLFGVPGTILFSRERKVLQRYWVTPLSVSRYLAGFGLGHLTLCAVQFGILYLLGRYAFHATISFAAPLTIALLVLAAVTFMAFGFLVAAMSKTANAGMAIANILNMPMMFLSGMFFPISGLPAFMLAVVYANPVSYLLEGLRKSVGVQAGTLMPQALTIVVPLVWIALSGLIASRRLKWDVGR